ncbi:Leucine zipper, homeobox-associated [Sesbania bispinosa]|nr:Leucine zipper, homeobox-associated [Sesbania bispinosa]
MEDDKACNMGLSLHLGLGGYVPKKENQTVNKPVASLDLTFGDEAIDKASKGFILKGVHEPPYEQSTENTNRKKLRLTKEQQAMLENSFQLHNTINPAQKRALAEQLNLKHRQVEVWFQNRRARTKLKQTEVDCEFLKKCCEKLSEENLRLKKELQELRALKVGPFSKGANWTVCSSCEKLLKPNEGNIATISNVVRNNTAKYCTSAK